MKYSDIRTLEELRDFVLYGDVQKVPISILGSEWTQEKFDKFDTEQVTRVKVAALIESMIKGL